MWTYLATVVILARLILGIEDMGISERNSVTTVQDQILDNRGSDLRLQELSPLLDEKEAFKSGGKKISGKNNVILQDMAAGYEKAISRLLKELAATSRENYKPKETLDERNKRDSASKDAEFTPLTSLMSWITLGTEALPARDVLDDPDPAWQEKKKSRAFSPWGGKRLVSSLYGNQNVKVRRPIRVPFNSWGGKRYDEGIMQLESVNGDKNEGGKFKYEDFIDKEENQLEKRTRFNSWGGKRTAFHSWGGKRAGGDIVGNRENEMLEEKSFINRETGKRTKFNAWGGKRSKNSERNEEETKRTRFNAWGGRKRSGDSADRTLNIMSEKRSPEETMEKKNTFSAWGGKRFVGDENVSRDDENDQSITKTSQDQEYSEFASSPPSAAIENNNNNNNINNKGWVFGSDIVGFPRDKILSMSTGIRNSDFDKNFNDKNNDNNYIRDDDKDVDNVNDFRNIKINLPTEMRSNNRIDAGEGSSSIDQRKRTPFNPWGGRKRGAGLVGNYIERNNGDYIGGGTNL
ncbi:transcription initiation factor TFIID subunit 1-like [Athalia rosae]|uniref:transcription initiation factor TFIID subunit 1-like n=1 Tax=Athalia rosae TaxID=37344 RepID=UPI00203476DA|nr:transcription initiation factor TFIID subunit 1-like [Athalia rosae]XP_048505797.1 transcription initiation factor TFIID subunit 1-like [Athalia rosae]